MVSRLSIPASRKLTCSDRHLGEYELNKLAEVANTREEMHEVLDRLVDLMGQASLVRWFRAQDRDAIKQALENPDDVIEIAKQRIRDPQRSPEDLIPRPSLPPGAAHLAAALRYSKRNIAEGKCCVCPEPLDRNSVRYCTEHMRKARDRKRAKKGPRSDPGSVEYLYSRAITPSGGRPAGTLQRLALNREKQTRRVLAEMGIPPVRAATARLAVQAAILKLLPTSEAVAVKENDIFAMIEAPSRSTARNALMSLLRAGKIGRVGQGVSGDPFRYFKRDA